MNDRDTVETMAPSFSGRLRQALGAPWRGVLGICIGALLLILAARGVRWGEMWGGLIEARLAWVFAAFLSVLLTTVLKIGRWRMLFPGAQRPDFFLAGRALLVGQMSNALLPVRVGELVRIYFVGAKGDKAAILGTIATEKAFDVVCLLLCSALTVVSTSLPSWVDVSMIGVAGGGLLVVVVALVLPQERILDLGARWAYVLPWNSGPKLVDMARRVLAGLAALRAARLALAAVAWSMVIWALAVSTNFLLFQAFGLPLSIGAAMLLLVVLHVGIAPSTTPGQLGVFHYLTVLCLEWFDIDRMTGLAYATVLHFIVYLPQVLPGALFLMAGRGRDRRQRPEKH